MKVLLLFPPQWVPYQPHLALPSLAAFLRSNGIETVQKDLNVESFDYFLSRKYLRSLKPAIDSRFAELDRRPVLAAGFEQHLYGDLFLARSSAYNLGDAIDDAKSVFRSTRYYDAVALSQARKTIENALSVISLAHYPTRLELMSFTMPCYDGTLGSIDKLTVDRDQNPYLEYFEQSALPYIQNQAPDLIGISIAGESQLIPALALSRLIKQKFGCHVVLGGYVVTLLADSFAGNREFFGKYCDGLMVLEGERPLLELAGALSNHQSLRSVSNLIYYDGESVRQNPIVQPEPMDSLPVPDFDGLPLKNYLSPEPVLPLLASRGCYWGKCAFCSHNVSYENKYRAASGKKIVADLETLRQKYGARHFAFSDEAIAPKVMRDVTARLIARNDDFRFSTNIRLELQFTPELCREMYTTGFRVVYLGLESGCDRVLGLMNKGFTKEGALQVCRNLVQAGIWDHLYVFLGFPGEAQVEAEETFRFLLENSAAIRSFNIGSFSLGRGSAVMNSPADYGVTVSPPAVPQAELALVYPHISSQGISREQAAEMSKAGWDRLAKDYPTGNVLKLLSKEDLLLYLSHFEAKDSALGTVGSEARTPQKSAWLTLESRPKIVTNIVRATINFDLPEILNRIILNRESVIQPKSTRVLFNPENRKMRPIGPNVSELLDLLDGRRTIRLIARQLALKHNVPEAALQAFCLDTLNQLTVEGYVIV